MAGWTHHTFSNCFWLRCFPQLSSLHFFRNYNRFHGLWIESLKALRVDVQKFKVRTCGSLSAAVHGCAHVDNTERQQNVTKKLNRHIVVWFATSNIPFQAGFKRVVRILWNIQTIISLLKYQLLYYSAWVLWRSKPILRLSNNMVVQAYIVACSTINR